MPKKSDSSRGTKKRSTGLEQRNPTEKPFTPDVLDRTVIAIPLLEKLQAQPGRPDPEPIIIDLNLDYPGGRNAARERVKSLVRHLVASYKVDPKRQGIDERKSKYSHQYLFGRLQGQLIQELVRLDTKGDKITNDANEQSTPGALYRIWPDFEVAGFINRSISTVKVDAAHNAFGAFGAGIVWAVMDSGVDGTHLHFRDLKNLELDPPLLHRDFTLLDGPDDDAAAAKASSDEALIDDFGHGTHVAGIIAGRLEAGESTQICAEVKKRDENGAVTPDTIEIPRLSGMAPQCKLLSLKVLDKDGKGLASSLIAAIEQIQEINGNGRRIRVHGVNMSVGYDFEPKWFACGQSPLCVEVDRLVKSGVVVVVAAGNTGYGWNQTAFRGAVAAGMDLTINDPGNAELAITVGSTHRDMPHVYGV